MFTARETSYQRLTDGLRAARSVRSGRMGPGELAVAFLSGLAPGFAWTLVPGEPFAAEGLVESAYWSSETSWKSSATEAPRSLTKLTASTSV